ncbi:uncharacterized protein LOC121193970 isoform X2 [Toxotes jaculatrix]|uniref:uncharacterized protein LOC121193970 isoform X2 n=1 Tax=Toxotes jaculatrix TaxID=941984 RepID=UPI001B3AED6E|nr:uncharacterized protein LOC121193970 isoform X2 [Toxotes jaculatrix]
MALWYTSSQLLRLNHRITPSKVITATLQHFGLLRRPYIHSGSRRKVANIFTAAKSTPSIWTDRNSRSSVLRHATSASTISKQKPLKTALFNTRSLNNKSLILNEFITDNKLDLLCLTETWHKPMDYVALNQTTPTGYSYVDNPRAEGRGGGIAVIHRDDLTLSPLSIPAASSFEHLAFRLPGPQSLTVAIIYRPPKTTSSFLSDFTDFFTQLSSISSSLLLLGDFNIHIDSPKCKFSADFLDILNCFNLTQHVNSPTHSRGHILDLVCSTACLCIQNLSLTDLAISDHLAITMDINIPIPGSKHTYTITFRNLKSLFPISFSSSISDIITASSFPANPTPPELVVYNRTLSTCLNQLAPLKTKTVSFSHSTQWYTPELHILKKKQRQLDSLCKTALQNTEMLCLHSTPAISPLIWKITSLNSTAIKQNSSSSDPKRSSPLPRTSPSSSMVTTSPSPPPYETLAL